MMSSSTLQYAPFSSALDSGFWHKLSQLKLDVYGLDEQSRSVTAHYANGDAQGLPCIVSLDFSSFDSQPKTPARCFPSLGTLKNTNTIEDFKNCDKKVLLDQQGHLLWQAITSGSAVKDPSLLARFFLLTHADLKKYHYYYWFAFPAVTAPESISQSEPPKNIEARFSQNQIASLLASYDALCLPQNLGFFLIQESGDSLQVQPLFEFRNILKSSDKVLFGVCDPCTLESHPGWPLRNFLTLIAYHWASELDQQVEVVCLRDRFHDGKRSVTHSIVLNLQVPSISHITECPKCVGWEKNERQKLGPRMVNLSQSMDPARLAESAVDLNLKLMRWRLMPQLDLAAIAATRCLLLGSGTLGCNVARCLMGWGVRNITLVDNGKVSYSNPVRQTLFTFEDSTNGGKPKAEAAAESLKRIFPGVNATGISLSIPMPGHAVVESAIDQTKGDVARLEELVQSHDAVFLLMDTRESRWLPSVMAAAHHKLVINAALGFDTYLVMRHGVRRPDGGPDSAADAMSGLSLTSAVPGSQLGCYFCNDVVAPSDSTRDRALDQQCTVSRPGISYIASALAAEILVSLIVHPNRGDACALVNCNNEDVTLSEKDSPLGIIPHQIRGFLSRFHQVMPTCRAFDKCTACSDTVVQHFRQDGFSFLLNAFNSPTYLEDLTGLTQLHADTADAEIWDLSDDDDAMSM